MAERPVVLFTWLRAAIALLLVLFVNMTFDYERIRLVAEDRRHAPDAADDLFWFGPSGICGDGSVNDEEEKEGRPHEHVAEQHAAAAAAEPYMRAGVDVVIGQANLSLNITL